MKISPLNINTKAASFHGIKERTEFRQEAKSIINDLKDVQLGTHEYTDFTIENGKVGKSLQERLLDAIFINPEKIGKKFITDEDRALHEKLKSLYKEYQEADDFADAMCGGGGHFVERTINYCI